MTGRSSADKLTHLVPEGEGTRLYPGSHHLDLPQTLAELENVLMERDWKDGGERGDTGIHFR